MSIINEIERQQKIKERQDEINKLYALCQVHEEVLDLISKEATISDINNYFINESKELKENINVLLATKI